jgi:lysophospholipase L1-like esterase
VNSTELVQSRRALTRILPLALALLALIAANPPVTLAGSGPEDNWVATWGASPSATAAALSNQTVREIERVSLGGKRLRIRLSNELTTAAVTVADAHIALAGAGSAIVPGSDRALTFSGQSSIAISPNAPVFSDPVDLDVQDLGGVAVSLYFPTSTGSVTTHQLGVATSYIANGDATGAASLPGAAMTTMRYLLSEIEVTARDDAAAIITLGDSITDGFNSTVDANHRWPDFLADRLAGQPGHDRRAVVNEGISGNRVLNDIAGPNALSRFDRDVLVHPGAAFLTVLEGINDIGLPGVGIPPEVSADDIIAGYKQLIERAHSKGLKIYGCTLTPFAGTTFPGYFTPAGEVKREAVNAFIRTSGAFDAVIDFDVAVRDPANPTSILPAYNSGDNLHPNDAGYQAMANAIDLRLFKRRFDED